MSVTYQVTVWCECGNWERVETPLSSRARAKLKKVGLEQEYPDRLLPRLHEETERGKGGAS
jgi:hypothetical protein